MAAFSYFLDSSYLIALLNPKDKHHKKAVTFALEARKGGIKFVTTRQIIFEIANFFSSSSFRSRILELIISLEEDPKVSIIQLSEEFYWKALERYRGHSDKDWGLTDCLSFTVMEEYGLTSALSADKHFSQAGFEIILR